MTGHDAGGDKEHIHYEGGIPILETPLERIEREQGEAKNRDKLYRDEQLKINRQQLKVNTGMMIFTLLLVLTSILSGGISLYQANISKISADAAKSAADTADATLKELQKNEASSTQQFQAQLGKLDSSIKQSGRLADATEKSNANVLEADRPWMGPTGSVVDFDSEKKPIFTVQFINSGKRPAKVTYSAYRATALPSVVPFPDDPEVLYTKPSDQQPSTNFVVPGQQVITNFSGEGKIEDAAWKLVNADHPSLIYYLFAKIEYTDPRTNERFWTHFCLRFYPKMKSSSDSGWRNCAKYNDAK